MKKYLPPRMTAAILTAVIPMLAVHPAKAATQAYWTFENGKAGTHVPNQQQPGNPIAAPDVSGNGNNLLAFADGTAPTSSSDTPGGVGNTLSVDFSEAPGQYSSGMFFGTRDLYNVGPVNKYLFSQFTIEASVKFDSLGGFQTFVGKDGYGIDSPNSPLASLYFQTPDPTATGGNSVFSIRTHQGNGQFIVQDGSTTIRTGTWYDVAAVMNSATNSLALYQREATTPYGAYTLEGSTHFVGPMPFQDRVWTVGRGLYNNNTTDQTHGLVDSVRISDTALSPDQFLFAPASAPVPEPAFFQLGGALAVGGLAFFRRRKTILPGFHPGGPLTA